MTAAPAGDLLLAIAARGLPGATGIPATRLDDDEAAALLDRARSERIVGLLDDAVAAGAPEVQADAARRIGLAAVEVASGRLLVERHTLSVHDLLVGMGIADRFLKGTTAAHRFGGDPSLRSFADVDVLVRGADVEATVTALLGAGHRRLQADWKPGFAATYGKSVTLRSEDGIEVDVHRTFASGPFGLAGDIATVWEHTHATVVVGGVDLPCLDPATAFVHACVHAVTGQRPTLASLREVARILPNAGDADIEVVERELRVAACTTAAVRLAVERLALGPDERRDRLASRSISRLHQAWLGQYRQGAHRFRRVALIGVTAVPTMRGKLAYAWALARP